MPLQTVSSEPLLYGNAVEQRGTGFGRVSSRDRLVNFAQDRMRDVKSVIPISREELRQQVRNSWRYGMLAGVTVIMTLAISTWLAVPDLSLELCSDLQHNVQTIKSFNKQSKSFVAVNLGGWLCLEDWFHSGAVGRYVSTPYTLSKGQGACLPPLLTGPLEEPWPSEGILVNRLYKADMGAAEIFTAFRESFITEQDFTEIASLGLKTVRIPFSWGMFADALAPLDKEAYGSHNPDFEAVVVPDPYYTDDVHMVTIPRKWFGDMLRMATKHGLKVVLDLHSMPGGSSDGTYSGIWPLRPVFWHSKVKLGNGTVPLRQAGVMIVQALIDYIENDLADVVAAGGIWGICFMNEPAHLSGINQTWGQFATSDQVLHDISLYANLFRISSLPALGVRLYIQLIETAWKNSEAFDSQVTGWYHSFFTAKERYTWAVMARHFYTAWGCNGAITQGSAYQCDEPTDKIRDILNTCIAGFAKDFALKFHGLRAVTEWSLGSHWDANLACKNSDVLRAIFEENVQAFALIDPEIQIEPMFWSWKMPYGPKFQQGWSLKTFAGMAELSASNGACIVGKWGRESPLH